MNSSPYELNSSTDWASVVLVGKQFIETTTLNSKLIGHGVNNYIKINKKHYLL